MMRTVSILTEMKTMHYCFKIDVKFDGCKAVLAFIYLELILMNSNEIE